MTEQEKIIYLLSKKETRVALCEHRLDLFAFYYFREFFTFKSQDFHLLWYKQAMMEENMLNVWFRESWKTAIIWVIYIIHCIVYHKYYFITFYCFDALKARAKTLNIANTLKINRYIKEDFWYLFRDSKTSINRTDTDAMQEQKKVEEFVTTNWIKLKAMSMGSSPRWELFLDKKWIPRRPDLVILDDIDIDKSVKTTSVIDSNYAFITWEVMWGIADYGKIMFLWNIIWEDWVIPRLIEAQSDNPDWIVSNIPLVNDADEIRWKDKFVWTDEEAKEINKDIEDPKLHITSLAAKLRTQGLNAFNSNYRNKPYQIIWEPVFDQNNVSKLKEVSPITWFNIVINKITTRLNIYDNCYLTEPLVVWIDVWGWIGKDYTEMEFRSITGVLVATWSSNMIKPWFISDVLTEINDRIKIDLYRNALVIENNNHWHVVIDRLRTDNNYLYRLLFRKNSDGSARFKSTMTLGWTTSWPSKDVLIEDLWLLVDNGKYWREIEELAKSFKKKKFDIDYRVTKSFKSQLRSYIIDDDWKKNAQNGSFDDKIIAWALVQQGLRYYKV